MKSIFLTLFSCLVFWSTSALRAQGDSPGPGVALGEFRVLDSEPEPRTAGLIQESLRASLKRAGFRVIIVGGGGPGRPPVGVANSGVRFYVAGFYTRTARGTLKVYGQIHHGQKGRVIDAYSVSFDFAEIPGIKLPPEELRIRDEDVLKGFTRGLVGRVLSNPRRRERRGNINEHLLATPPGRKIKFPVGREDVSAGAADVFRLLEDQVVVTATRDKTRVRDAPAAVYVITHKQIRARGYRTLVDALHDVPGFNIQHVYGIFPELIHQRGLIGNNQRTLLYVDGILDNNLTESAVLGGSLRFPLYNVERIEIISGSASALYGANAFNGVINIITREGASDPGIEANFMYGAYESRFRRPGAAVNVNLRGTTGKGPDAFQYSLAGYVYRTQGPNFGGLRRLEKPTSGSAQAVGRKLDGLYALETELCGGVCAGDGTSVGYFWSPYFNVAHEETYNITAKVRRGGFRMQAVNWQYLQGDGTFANGTRQIDVKQRGLETSATDSRNNARRLGVLLGLASPAGFSGSYWNFRNNSLAIGYLHEFSPKLNLDSEVVLRNTEILSSSHEEVPNQPGPYAYLRPGDVTIFRDYSRPDYAYEIHERLRYKANRRSSTTIGLEAMHVVVPSGYNSERRIRTTNYGLYIQQLYQLTERTALTGGYRYDFNTDYGTSHTPRISAVVNVTETLNLKFLLSTGFRAPTAWELFNETAQRRANPNLKPERLRTAEVGAGWRFRKRFFFGAQAYYNDIKDLLLEVETSETNPAIPGTNLNRNENVGRVRMTGAELQFHARITKELNLFLNYTYSRGEYIELPDPVTLSASPSTRGRPGDDPLVDGLIALYKDIRTREPVLVEFLENETGHEFSPYKGPIPNFAPHHVNVGGTWFVRPGTSLHLRANFVGVRRTIATNPEATVEASVLLHGSIRWEDAWWPGFSIQLTVRNLTNEASFDPGIRTATGGYFPTRHPLEGRNIWLTAGLKF